MKLSLWTHSIFNQSPVPSRAVRTIAVLGDDAFQSKRAGVLQKCDAVTLHLLGKLDSADRAVEKIFQEGLRTDSSVPVRS